MEATWRTVSLVRLKEPRTLNSLELPRMASRLDRKAVRVLQDRVISLGLFGKDWGWEDSK